MHPHKESSGGTQTHTTASARRCSHAALCSSSGLAQSPGVLASPQTALTHPSGACQRRLLGVRGA
eukprot:10203714-Alexandrium_andersonii.AAC.1